MENYFYFSLFYEFRYSRNLLISHTFTKLELIYNAADIVWRLSN